MKKRIIRILGYLFLLLIVMVVALYFLIRIPSVQTSLVNLITKNLSEKLQTKVEIGSVDLAFFTRFKINHIFIQDENKDTLFYAQSLKTDFKLFDLIERKIVISGIEIENSNFYFYNDSIENRNSLSFILEKFKTDNTNNKSSAQKWIINLDEITIKNHHFKLNDYKSKSTVNIFAPTLILKGKDISLHTKNFQLSELKAEGLNCYIHQWGVKEKRDTIKLKKFLPEGYSLDIAQIKILNSILKFKNSSTPKVIENIDGTYFNFNEPLLSGIHIDFKNVKVFPDSIKGNLNSLTAIEKSGLKLKETKADLFIGTTGIYAHQLNLKTGFSDIKGDIDLKYNELHDLKDFLNKVTIDANLQETKISSEDLRFIHSYFRKIEVKKINISGELKGKLSSIYGKELKLSTDRQIWFNGELSLNGLPKFSETFISLRVKNAGANINEIQSFIPNIKLPKNLYSLGQVRFKGSMDGFISDLVANGDVETSLGSMTTDINLKFDTKTKKSSYIGKVSLRKFDIGKLFEDDKNIGRITMNVNLKGKGVTLESLNAELDGEISEAVFKNYPYKNISISGVVQNKSFNGSLKVKDENIQGQFNGLLDLQKETPEYNFEATLDKIDFKKLNLLETGNLNIKGNFSGNFKGKKPDDFTGSINFNKILITRNDSLSTYIDETEIFSTIDPHNERIISLRSDEIEADVRGNFKFSELVPGIKTLAKSIIWKDSLNTSQLYNQDLSFNIRIYDPGQLSRIIDPKLKLIRNTKISGELDSKKNRLSLNAFIPEFIYNNIKISKIDFKGFYADNQFNSIATINDVFINDSLMIDSFCLTANRENEDILFKLSGNNKKGNNKANITATLKPSGEFANLYIDPSEVYINNKLWTFSKNNSIYIKDKKITSKNLFFTSDISTIYVSSFIKNDTSTCVQVNLSQTNLGDFTGLFLTKKVDVNGSINGKILVENIFSKPNFTGDIVVEELKLGKELIGDIALSSSLDLLRNRLELDASIKSSVNNISATGFYSLDNKNPGFTVDVFVQKLGLNFLNYSFFERYVKQVEGTAHGKIRLSKVGSKLGLTGKLNINEAWCTVTYTNVKYRLENEEVNLGDGFFDFGTIIGRDLKGNILVGTGKIHHENLKIYTLDLKVSSDNGLFLNTGEKENPAFYGTVYGSGYVTFKGNIKTPLIKGYVKTLQGTHCYLPIRDTYETGKYSFYKFLDPKQDSAQIKKSDFITLRGVTFVMDIDVTPDAEMEIILDPGAGDKLVGKGKGNLKIDIQRTGEISMYGQYEIEKGNYNFSLQNVILKPFTIEKGGTVNFSGNIYKAELDVNASYGIRTSTHDLIWDLITDPITGIVTNKQVEALSKNIIPVKLLLQLNGPLEKPGIAFDIKPQLVDPGLKTFLDSKLQLVKNTESELNKQVFGLLVMNRFLPASLTPTGALGNSQLLGSSVASTLSEFLSNQLSLYANNLLATFVEGLNLNIGYRQYNELNENNNTGNTYDSRNAVQIALSKYFLQNRLSVSAGGNVDFGSTTGVDSLGGTSRNRNAVFAGDFQIEYSITPDGSWRARAYNRTDFNNYNNRNNNRTGLGLSYRKEFENWRDFFNVKKKKSKKSKDQPVKLKTAALDSKEIQISDSTLLPRE